MVHVLSLCVLMLSLVHVSRAFPVHVSRAFPVHGSRAFLVTCQKEQLSAAVCVPGRSMQLKLRKREGMEVEDVLGGDGEGCVGW